MDKDQMIIKLQQLANNQDNLCQVLYNQEDEERAEFARIKKVMYENFIELLEDWLEA